MHQISPFIFRTRFRGSPNEPSVFRCFIAILFFLPSINSFATPQTAENLNRIEKAVAISNSIDGTIIAEIDLGTLKVGSVNKTTVLMENKLGKPIEFLKASVSCNCISVIVPKVELASEKQEKLVFDFAVSGAERNVFKSYDVEIQTSGAADRILLRFKAKIAGVVAFEEDSVVFDVSSKDSLDEGEESGLRQLKHIRIVTSEIALLLDAVVEKSDAIKDLFDAKISIIGEGATLELQGKPVRLPRGPISGEVTLKGSAFNSRTLGVRVREKRPIEFFPNVLVFGSRSEDSMSATAIVRIRNPEVENPDDNLRVLCTLPEGQRIDSTLSKLSTGIYRITIEIPKSISKKYSADSIELCMAFKTTRLDQVLFGNARFTW